MRILLFLAIVLTGCSDNYSRINQDAPPTQNLLHPYSKTLPIATQKITEPSLVLGIIVGSAIAFLSLKRQ